VYLKSGEGTKRIPNKRVNGMDIHPSFSTILKDKTRGGVLLSNVILNLHKQNKLGLALFLTPIGIKASHDLINMLNLLPTNNNSKFKGDNLLLDYLNSKTNMVIRYNMENSLKTIIPIVGYDLPIAYQRVLDEIVQAPPPLANRGEAFPFNFLQEEKMRA
jgi:hypothetical protein